MIIRRCWSRCEYYLTSHGVNNHYRTRRDLRGYLCLFQTERDRELSNAMNTFAFFTCRSITLDFNFSGGLRTVGVRTYPIYWKPPFVWFQISKKMSVITMRDRGSNRKPLQRGRISIEAIQTVQSLKRAKKDEEMLNRVFVSKVSRLVKSDMIDVLRELQRQNEAILALQVFEDVRKEYWYKPKVSLYGDMIKTLASNNLFEKVELLMLYMKDNCLDPDTEGFNALFKTLMEYNLTSHAMNCFYLMKEAHCEPDRSTFRILINGLESKGETSISYMLRQEAEKYFGWPLDFLEETEESISCN